MTSNNSYDCSLMIRNVNLMDNGDYYFIVSNTNGSKMSETASLSVIGWLILNYMLLHTSIICFIYIYIYIYIIHPFYSLSLSLVPPPNVTILPGSVNVSYNSTVTLYCMVHSLTTPTVIWTTVTNVTLPSTFLVSSNDNNVHTSTLLLEQVTLEYIGEYTCTAQNVGAKISIKINVDVYGKEIIMCIHLSICLTIV